MSGDIDSTIESKLHKYEEELDNIIDKIGISFVKDETSIEALSLSYEQLKAMDQQECCILAYKLAQYGMYVQSVYNRLASIKNWGNQCLERIVGKYAKNYGDGYTKFEEKKACVIVENSAAGAISKVILKSHGKMSELNTLSQKINNCSNILLELSKSKRFKLNG